LRISPPEGRPRYALVLPGSHRVGTGAQVELRIGDGSEQSEAGEQVLAVIEWAGAPKLAELVAHAPGITLDGQAVTERVPLSVGSTVEVGGVALALSYPKG
jgi:hypothetical protein